MSLGARLDALLHARAALRRHGDPPGPDGTRWLDTDVGRLRLFDSDGTGPAIVLAPDGPCVIEHYAALIDRLRGRLRVICFDLPGFGYSYPRAGYGHGIGDGAGAVLAVMETLDLRAATLALSCVNGFYGIAAAARAPDRIARIVLAQTPSLDGMMAWTNRIVPKPIRVPLIGQIANYATRRKVAHNWYKVALANRSQREAFQQTADQALSQGACYCFASVVQGMSHEPAQSGLLRGADVPATLVWGVRDRSHAKTDPESIRELLPQVRVERFEDCGHFPDLENPVRYAALIDTLHHSQD